MESIGRIGPLLRNSNFSPHSDRSAGIFCTYRSLIFCFAYNPPSGRFTCVRTKATFLYMLQYLNNRQHREGSLESVAAGAVHLGTAVVCYYNIGLDVDRCRLADARFSCVDHTEHNGRAFSAGSFLQPFVNQSFQSLLFKPWFIVHPLLYPLA